MIIVSKALTIAPASPIVPTAGVSISAIHGGQM